MVTPPLAWHRRPMVRRVIAGTGSNAYAQATTIAIQLLSLPLFLSHWDVAIYGQWLVLSAVPAYLAMADVGMVTAAGNRMTMLISQRDTHAANAVFQSALAFVLAVCALLMLLVLGTLPWWPGLSGDGRAAIGWLSATVIATLIGGLPEAVYKSTERYALGAALANTVRLAEWLGTLAGLWWFGSYTAVALGAFLPRALFTLVMIVHAARSTPALHWNLRAATLAEVRHCAKPALSFMAFPAANALNFQGMTLLCAALLGPAATVVFNSYRTMSRVTVQATATFSHALWPEFSKLYGQRDLAALAALYRRSWLLGLALAFVAGVVAYVCAAPLLQLWSKGRIAFDPTLMALAMVYAAAAGAWHVPRVLLLSTNEHSALAWPLLLASLACLPLAAGLAKALGLNGLMLAMLALEVAMLAYCVYLARRLLLPVSRSPQPLEATA